MGKGGLWGLHLRGGGDSYESMSALPEGEEARMRAIEAEVIYLLYQKCTKVVLVGINF
jgi:hypothetical protein